MIYTDMNEVPEDIRSIDGVSLTLNQINKIVEMAAGSELPIAMSQWKKAHVIKDDKWVINRDGDPNMERFGFKFSGSFKEFNDCYQWMDENGIEYLRNGFRKRDGAIIYHTSAPVGNETHEQELIPGVTLLATKRVDKKASELRTVDMPGVEILKPGTWRSVSGEVTLTKANLEEMAANFAEMNPLGHHFPVVIGHGDGQKFLQEQGQPAAGWIENVKMRGDSLVCDFKKVPGKIADLIKAQAFRKRSAEFYTKFYDVVAKKVRGYTLTAVALLGAEMPAVVGLDDIVNFYKQGDVSGDSTNTVYTFGSDQEADSEVITYNISSDGLIELSQNKNAKNGGIDMEDKEKLEKLERERAELEVKLKAEVQEKIQLAKEKEESDKKAAEEAEALKVKLAAYEKAETEKAEAESKERLTKFKALLGDKLEPAEHEVHIEDFKGRDAEGQIRFAATVEKWPDAKELRAAGKTDQDGDDMNSDDDMDKIVKFAASNDLDLKKPADYKAAAIGALVEPKDPVNPNMSGGDKFVFVGDPSKL